MDRIIQIDITEEPKGRVSKLKDFLSNSDYSWEELKVVE